MLPEQRIQWHILRLRLTRNSRKLLSTIQIFLLASLLLNSFGQEHIVNVDSTSAFTSVYNKRAVKETAPFLSISNDPDLETLTQVYLDNHVAGYVSNKISLNILWPFKIASKVWAYVKTTYGSYGSDPHIYVILYVNTTPQGSTRLKKFYATHIDADFGFKNVVKIGKQSENAWMNEVNTTAELLHFTFMVGNIVKYSSGNTKGFPGYNNYYDDTYRSSAWNHVFVYDTFSKIGMEQESMSFLAAHRNSFLTQNGKDFEENLDADDQVNWIKNWFWPIYSKYGVQALSQFITNCNTYFARQLLNRTNSEASSYYKFTKKMNKGEFVHFWSGSVGLDLRYLANFAFTWDLNDEKNFQSARDLYLMLKYQCDDNSCKQLPVLDKLVTGLHINVLNSSKTDEPRPAIAVISEQKINVEEPIRKRVKGTLYRPLNKTEPYLYDGKNELYIFKAPPGLCYYITCSAPYIIKWVTNIPLKERLEYQGCQIGKHLNSLRLQDITHNKKALKDQRQETLSQTYTIQFIIPGVTYGSNMGLLKCERIQNSTQAMHIFFTNSKSNTHEYFFPLNNNVAELFWSDNADQKLIVPCIGTSIKIIPELRIRTKGNSDGDWTKWKTIWDKQNKTIDAESVKYNVTYDPVIGFTIAYEIWPFDRILNTGEHLYFNCVLKTESRKIYKAYVTSKKKTLTSKLTIVDSEHETAFKDSGCFIVKQNDHVIFVGNETNFENYPLKLISCSTPHACDLFRRCLDYVGTYCFSDQRELQAGYTR